MLGIRIVLISILYLIALMPVICAAPKPLEDQKKPPYKPRLAERSGGWIAQMVRAVDS